MTVLSAARRAELAAVPMQVEGGAPVAACVVAAAGGWNVAWAHDGGRRKQAFGDPYGSPLEAAAAAAFLNARSFGPAR